MSPNTQMFFFQSSFTICLDIGFQSSSLSAFGVPRLSSCLLFFLSPVQLSRPVFLYASTGKDIYVIRRTFSQVFHMSTFYYSCNLANTTGCFKSSMTLLFWVVLSFRLLDSGMFFSFRQFYSW